MAQVASDLDAERRAADALNGGGEGDADDDVVAGVVVAVRPGAGRDADGGRPRLVGEGDVARAPAVDDEGGEGDGDGEGEKGGFADGFCVKHSEDAELRLQNGSVAGDFITRRREGARAQSGF